MLTRTIAFLLALFLTLPPTAVFGVSSNNSDKDTIASQSAILTEAALLADTTALVAAVSGAFGRFYADASNRQPSARLLAGFFLRYDFELQSVAPLSHGDGVIFSLRFRQSDRTTLHVAFIPDGSAALNDADSVASIPAAGGEVRVLRAFPEALRGDGLVDLQRPLPHVIPIIQNNLNGLKLMPILLALKGTFESFGTPEDAQWVSSYHFAGRHAAGRADLTAGNVTDALHSLALQGWMYERGIDREKEFTPTPLGWEIIRLVQEGITDVVEPVLRDLPWYHSDFRNLPSPDAPGRQEDRIQRYKKLVELSLLENPWNLRVPDGADKYRQRAALQMRRLLDGFLMTPTLIALGMPLFEKDFEGFVREEARPIFFTLDPTLPSWEASARSQGYNLEYLLLSARLLESVGLLERRADTDGLTYQLTEIGRQMVLPIERAHGRGAERTRSHGVTNAYSRQDDLEILRQRLFGNPEILDVGAGEHLAGRRYEDAWGSSGGNAVYGARIVEWIQAFFDVSASEQPPGIVDIGTGEARHLVRTAETILIHILAHTDRDLATQPFYLIGTEYTEGTPEGEDPLGPARTILNQFKDRLHENRQFMTRLAEALGHDTDGKELGDFQRIVSEELGDFQALIEKGVQVVVVDANLTRPGTLDETIGQATGNRVRLNDLVPTHMFILEERPYSFSGEPYSEEVHAEALRIIRERVEELEEGREPLRQMLAILGREILEPGDLEKLEPGRFAALSPREITDLISKQLTVSSSYNGRMVPGVVVAADLILFMEKWLPYLRYGSVFADQHTPRLTPSIQTSLSDVPDDLDELMPTDWSSAPAYWTTHSNSHQLIPPLAERSIPMFLMHTLFFERIQPFPSFERSPLTIGSLTAFRVLQDPSERQQSIETLLRSLGNTGDGIRMPQGAGRNIFQLFQTHPGEWLTLDELIRLDPSLQTVSRRTLQSHLRRLAEDPDFIGVNRRRRGRDGYEYSYPALRNLASDETAVRAEAMRAVVQSGQAIRSALLEQFPELEEVIAQGQPVYLGGRTVNIAGLAVRRELGLAIWEQNGRPQRHYVENEGLWEFDLEFEGQVIHVMYDDEDSPRQLMGTFIDRHNKGVEGTQQTELPAAAGDVRPALSVLESLKSRGIRLPFAEPRPGLGGALNTFFFAPIQTPLDKKLNRTRRALFELAGSAPIELDFHTEVTLADLHAVTNGDFDPMLSVRQTQNSAEPERVRYNPSERTDGGTSTASLEVVAQRGVPFYRQVLTLILNAPPEARIPHSLHQRFVTLANRLNMEAPIRRLMNDSRASFSIRETAAGEAGFVRYSEPEAEDTEFMTPEVVEIFVEPEANSPLERAVQLLLASGRVPVELRRSFEQFARDRAPELLPQTLSASDNLGDKLIGRLRTMVSEAALEVPVEAQSVSTWQTLGKYLSEAERLRFITRLGDVFNIDLPSDKISSGTLEKMHLHGVALHIRAAQEERDASISGDGLNQVTWSDLRYWYRKALPKGQIGEETEVTVLIDGQMVSLEVVKPRSARIQTPIVKSIPGLGPMGYPELPHKKWGTIEVAVPNYSTLDEVVYALARSGRLPKTFRQAFQRMAFRSPHFTYRASLALSRPELAAAETLVRQTEEATQYTGRGIVVDGNWKMKINTLDRARELAGEVAGHLPAGTRVEIAVFPSYVHLDHTRQALADTDPAGRIVLGAQGLSPYEPGSKTQQVSWAQVADSGAQVVLLGHSEPTHDPYIPMPNALVSDQAIMAQRHGLQAIIALGETFAERQAGRTFEVLERQARERLAGLYKLFTSGAISEEDLLEFIRALAYEPVWAIGTGLTASPEQAAEAHRLIRAVVLDMFSERVAREVRIQYGGSMDADKAYGLLTQPGIDGGLIGTAALDGEGFTGIHRAGDRVLAERPPVAGDGLDGQAVQGDGLADPSGRVTAALSAAESAFAETLGNPALSTQLGGQVRRARAQDSSLRQVALHTLARQQGIVQTQTTLLVVSNETLNTAQGRSELRVLEALFGPEHVMAVGEFTGRLARGELTETRALFVVNVDERTALSEALELYVEVGFGTWVPAGPFSQAQFLKFNGSVLSALRGVSGALPLRDHMHFLEGMLEELAASVATGQAA